MMSNLALLWVAIEVTTVISALLVAIEDTDGAAEAAWKYVLLASAGLGLALLATIFAYYAGAQVLGQSYDLGLPAAAGRGAAAAARRGAARVRAGGARLRHQDGPGAGAHLAAGRALRGADAGVRAAVRVAAGGQLLRDPALLPGGRGGARPTFPANVLLVFGVASLLLAALYLFGQRDIKRLLAYSSVEHMGILAIGVSFGAPAALAGVLLHVLAHAAAKGNAFMGAGVLVRKFGTKRISAIRGGLDLLPWSGPLFLLAIFALGAMPPFGLFRSEFEIVAGGLGVGQLRGRRDPDHRRHGGVLRAGGVGDPDADAAAPGPTDASAEPGAGPGRCAVPSGSAAPPPGAQTARARRARRWPAASRAPGWSCRSRPARSRCCCSACIRRPSSTELFGRAVALLGGGRRDRRHRAGARRERPRAVGPGGARGRGRRPAGGPVRHRARRRTAADGAAAGRAGITTLDALVPAGQASYPALTPLIGSAFWYEREIHDLFGVVPEAIRGWSRWSCRRADRSDRGPAVTGGPAPIDPDPRSATARSALACSRSRTARSARA